MTGMGRDGVDGCKAILAAGGFTLGQDEATSVVYGMNKAAFLEGAVKAQFALDEFPASSGTIGRSGRRSRGESESHKKSPCLRVFDRRQPATALQSLSARVISLARSGWVGQYR